jgi:hypothetical protein
MPLLLGSDCIPIFQFINNVSNPILIDDDDPACVDDIDDDGVPDCEDGCPEDPDKVEPGECGCDFIERDGDNDGVCDDLDECPGGNDLSDFDDDDVPDDCDNCPGVFNPEQFDSDEIGIGDACVLCGDTCLDANDGACDDGGPGSDFDLCDLGTDCSDCGLRSASGDESICDDGLDNDRDSLIDCEDIDCRFDFGAGCLEGVCDDGEDNDDDGLIDCVDDDCEDAPVCNPENLCELGDCCADGVDNDLDGFADCDDDDCLVFELEVCVLCDDTCLDANDGDCDDGGPGSDFDLCDLGTDCGDCGLRSVTDDEVICDDGLDNDRDSLIDCEDIDCRFDVEAGCAEAACDDGADNDNDGFIDCVDDDCEDAPVCNPENLCELGDCCVDGVDNDLDGFVDCDDDDCLAFDLESCVLCDDTCPDANDGDCDDGGPGSDFDLCDLGTDCGDCGLRSVTDDEVICDDGLDNDRDSLIDCEDIDCRFDVEAGCAEGDCDDGVDNDGDGFIDCVDEDCEFELVCL